MQKSFISHSDLVKLGALWLNKKAENINTRCPYVLTEFLCQGQNEIPDIFGLCPYHNVMIEVKVSRSDFKSDFKKRGRSPILSQIGNRRYYLCPENMIKIEEVPAFWGLLYVNQMKQISVIKKSEWFDCNYENVVYFYHSILRRSFPQQVFKFKQKDDAKIN
jgi:hypothetical protein